MRLTRRSRSQIRVAFGRQWRSPDLTHDWMVGLRAREPSDNIRALMGQVIPWWCRLSAQVTCHVVRQWNEPQGSTAGQLLLTVSAGVSSNPDQLNAILLERAEAKVKKLRETVADERHLIVWMDSSHAEAEPAFRRSHRPKPRP